MEDLDGFKKINKTRILPLRWVCNILGRIAIRSLNKAFALQGTSSYRFKFHCKVWKYLYKPYEKWGSYYS